MIAIIEIIGKITPLSVRTGNPAFVITAGSRQLKLIIDVPFQILGQSIIGGAVHRFQRGARFQLLLVPLQVGILPTVRVPEVHSRHAFYLSDGQSEGSAFPDVAILTHPAGAGQFHLVRTLPGDNINDPGNGIASIKGGGSSLHNFNAFDIGRVQQVQVVLVRLHPRSSVCRQSG
ncbi:Uncharacterised protein [uncultured Bacteroides sp.]|nr:Uncharacterised protein [uncultured Bacteroides sp.]